MSRASHAECARALVADTAVGALSTTDRNDGTPYASLTEYATLEDGSPLLFISSLAEHTKNIDGDAACSLLVADDVGADRPLARPRATLVGQLDTPDDSREELAARYLDAHPHAEPYIDFEDFSFLCLRPDRIRYIGGFGDMSWVDGDAYREAEPDPVWPARDEIRDHMNDDHGDALVDLAEGLGDVEGVVSARLTQVDRYGFDLEVEADDIDDSSIRLTFDDPLDAAEESRHAFVDLVERARSTDADPTD